MACMHMHIITVVVMVGLLAFPPPSVLADTFKCCGTEFDSACPVLSGTYNDSWAEVIMLGTWEGCATADEGWCILDCQANSTVSCLYAIAAVGNCTYGEPVSGTWTVITSVAAVGIKALPWISPSMSVSAAIKALFA